MPVTSGSTLDDKQVFIEIGAWWPTIVLCCNCWYNTLYSDDWQFELKGYSCCHLENCKAYIWIYASQTLHIHCEKIETMLHALLRVSRTDLEWHDLLDEQLMQSLFTFGNFCTSACCTLRRYQNWAQATHKQFANLKLANTDISFIGVWLRSMLSYLHPGRCGKRQWT